VSPARAPERDAADDSTARTDATRADLLCVVLAGGAKGVTGNLLISIFGPNRILPALVQRSFELKVYTFLQHFTPTKNRQ
jgi:hypothetical protein